MNKKGTVYSLDDVPKVTLSILLASVFFVVAIIIVASIGDNSNFSPVTTLTNESFTMPALNDNITLANVYVTSVTSVANSTGTVFPAANYTLFKATTSQNGVIQFLENASVCKTGATCKVTYIYNDHNTSQGVVITNTLNAITEIPNNWLLLFVTVLAAAIIIGIVIKNMSGYTSGR